MINYTMKVEALFLFLILLLGLVLCSFLGGNCNSYEGFTQNTQISDSKDSSGNLINALSSNNSSNTNSNSKSNSMFGNTNSSSNIDNYNHYNGSSSQLTNGATFTEPNGGSVVVNTSSDGTQSLQVTPSGGGTPMTFTVKESMTTYSGNNGSAAKFYGPNGQTAVVIKTNDGQQAIKITDSNNNSVTYTSSGTTAVHSSETNTTYFGSTGSNLPSSSYSTAYTGNASAGAVTGPQGNTAGYVTGPQGNTVYGTNVDSNNSSYGTDYYSTLPQGIPKSQIIPGQEDLYILKSQVVPPVCPVCPVAAATGSYKDEEKCPACPACARCPEPAFDCKKVPNYSAVNSSYLPMPVLSDFSSFGM